MPTAARRLTSVLLSAAALLLYGSARAQQTWIFDQTTTGQDIHWVSPTSVDPAAAAYDTQYQLDLVEVKVKWSIFTLGPFDITDQIPPDVASGTANIAGPSPILMFSDTVVYPEPPDPPSIAAGLSMGLDGAGFGFFDAVNVVLGTMTMDVPPFGTITAQIINVRIKGSLTIDETPWLDLGAALAGSLGDPTLTGAGDLVAGQAMSVMLGNALPEAALTLIVGFSEVGLPFKGGTLVPSVDLIVAGLSTGATGSLTLGTTWPPGVPAGFTLVLQGWIADPAGPKGFAASNGLRGTADGCTSVGCQGG